MKKNVVLFYSKRGSNKFLANKISEKLNCEIYPIIPNFNSLFYLIFSALFNRGLGIKKLNIDITGYENIILCGPLMMGKVVSPINDFLRKYKDKISNLHFVCCCGSTDESKNDKFGYVGAFDMIKSDHDIKFITSEAFPIDLVIPGDKKGDDQAMMKTRLSDENFNGEIEIRLDRFLSNIS